MRPAESQKREAPNAAELRDIRATSNRGEEALLLKGHTTRLYHPCSTTFAIAQPGFTLSIAGHPKNLPKPYNYERPSPIVRQSVGEPK
jgi:hypothetical protein